MKKILILLFIGILSSCSSEVPTQFSEVAQEVGITFSNDLQMTEEFNPYTFRSFYNGGGIAIGDVNNDGFEDIYFTGNQVSNKLFLNNGDWTFTEVASEAGVACEEVWSTGATFADINQDGWLDLYVCKSGAPGGANRANSLFLNNGDGTFTNKAQEFGLDEVGLSVQGAFFDFDKDGDLDVYLLTNSFRSVGTGADIRPDSRNIPDANNGGNKLFLNEDGVFTDVSQESGIYTSAIGFGLGVTIGDFNYDSWPDIFVSNDFFEKDYLYINNQDRTFTESGDLYFNSLSLGSMGADVGDINNDGLLDLVVTEMLPRTLERQKTKNMYESWNKQDFASKNGYHYQYPRNMLHLGLESGGFSDIGRMTGLASSEWSWGSLLFDMDNDGLDDVFISNGIYQDLLDRDFLSYTANESNIRNLINEGEDAILKLLDQMPSKPVSNMAVRNKGGLQFEDMSKPWGIDAPTFSNGSAYADLDNDGDLDFVVNNVNQPAQVFRNNNLGESNGISIKLQGDGNVDGIGAEITIFAGGTQQRHENFPVKGYQSSSSSVVHFGLGKETLADSIQVIWPSGNVTVSHDLEANQRIVIKEMVGGAKNKNAGSEAPDLFQRASVELSYTHQESNFVDFDRNGLLTEMHSNLGARFASADINGDSLLDFYFGGSKNSIGALYLSNEDSYVIETNFLKDAQVAEDMDAVFFDADGDGDLDLYVASGGVELSPASNALSDRLYILNEKRRYINDLSRLPSAFRVNTSFVRPADFDSDGDIDLLVGERSHPLRYGVGGSLHLLVNDGRGYFSISQEHTFEDIKTTYLLSDAQWVDINADGMLDIVAVGEWAPIILYLNDGTAFSYASQDYGLEETVGWWNTLEVADLNGDSRPDLVVGNKGRNSFFDVGTTLHTADFDGNGFIDNVLSIQENGQLYPIHDKDELVSHFPILKKSSVYYSEYAKQTTEDLFTKEGLNQALSSTIDVVESSVFLQSDASFTRVPLPIKTQFGPIYAIEVDDLNRDGWLDLVVGGNQYNVKPQFGRYDALRGMVIFGSEDGFQDKNAHFTDVNGQIRDIKVFEIDGKKHMLFFRNNDETEIISFR